MAADNWRKTGSPLGTNDIMRGMFRRDGKKPPSSELLVRQHSISYGIRKCKFVHREVIHVSTILTSIVFVLMISDGVMCALTSMSWIIQLLVLHDYIDWNRTGWILQNVRLII